MFYKPIHTQQYTYFGVFNIYNTLTQTTNTLLLFDEDIFYFSTIVRFVRINAVVAFPLRTIFNSVQLKTY